MADWLADTGDVTYHYCPTCSPDYADEPLTTIRWCDAHKPAVDGTADKLIEMLFDSNLYMGGSSDPDSGTCRAWAEMIRSGRPRPQGAES